MKCSFFGMNPLDSGLNRGWLYIKGKGWTWLQALFSLLLGSVVVGVDTPGSDVIDLSGKSDGGHVCVWWASAFRIRFLLDFVFCVGLFPI